MSARTLGRLLTLYVVLLLAVALSFDMFWSLGPISPVDVTSRYEGGQRARRDGAGDVHETAIAEGPLSLQPLMFALGLVPGRDGVRAELDGKVAWATPDDLYARGAYDAAYPIANGDVRWGTRLDLVLAILAEQLGVTPDEIVTRARVRRVRFERRAMPVVLTNELVRTRIAEAALHLARALGPDGRFRYLVDAPSNRSLGGYNWPRHSGATFFLAQAAGFLDDPVVRAAALRAADRLRDATMRDCGRERCIAGDEAPVADIGSSSLALVAFTEIVRTHADDGCATSGGACRASHTAYRKAIGELASFLRSQQRADGEMLHFYDRPGKRPIDHPALYYTGEATLALARAHTITGNPADLAAAERALGFLSGTGWSFFGSRYYYGEEHWTCQAVAELWTRAPNREALDFCARWHGYQRRLQQGPDDSPFDGDGSFNFGPIASPRVTPASSRGEAAGALLDILVTEQQAGRAAPELAAVDDELRRALGFVIRQQLSPGPTYLFRDPVAVRGAVPGSPVDPVLRIDYAQHAGSMMIRWLEVNRRRE